MTTKKTFKGTKTALVLTGGGARAAYQVGVLSAISKFVPRNSGIPFPIVTGTSAGAINATALACYASCFHLGVKKLEWVWKNLHTKNIYHSSFKQVAGHLTSTMFSSLQADYANKRSASLLNNAPLRHLLNSVVNYKRIDSCITQGFLSALSITASSYTSGDSISFYQSAAHLSPWFRSKRRGVPCQLNSEHLLASSAIPLVFPSVKIGKEHYGDGSVHQLAPLSPAIHLGAEKIFVIGVEQPKEPGLYNENNPHPPSTATIAGHLLDSIFADTLHSDLERMHRINNTLSLISPQDKKQKPGLKPIESYVINPSHDFNVIANQYYYELPFAIRQLLRVPGIKSNSESSLLSYLLFENSYCKQLIKLGFEDTMTHETNIREFLNL